MGEVEASASGGLPHSYSFWVTATLVGMSVAVFAPVWTFDFVSYDDPWYVTQNPHVAGGLSWRGLWWALTTGYLFYWHPVTWLSHMIDVQLFDLRAGGHHLTSLLIHIANAGLLFGLLRKVTGAPWRSALVAAAFAVHPLRVESVAWIAERKDVLSTLFLMLTLRAYVAYVARRTARRYLAVLLCFAVGLMAKPMLVTLPVLLLLLDVWPLGRFGGRAALTTGTASRLAAARSLLVEKLPLFGLALAAGVATFAIQWRVGAVADLTRLSLDFRLANGLLSYVAYIGRFLWPVGLAVFYPYPPALPPWWQVAAAGVTLVAVTLAAFRALTDKPYLLVGWLWYVVSLLPVSGIFQAGDQLMADRFTYVPLVGIFVIVVWGGADLVANRPRVRRAAAAAAMLLVAASAVAAHAQVRHWRNSETLWRRAAAVTVGNHRAHASLGALLAAQGKTDEAIAEYRAALKIVPGHAEWRNNLGLLYAQQGKVVEAMGQFAIAVRMQPGLADVHTNLGAMLARAGRLKEAIAQYTEAIRLSPTSALAHQNLAIALAGEGRLDEALQACLESLRLDASHADWHVQAASLFHRLGDDRSALAHLEKALGLDPRHETARRALGELRDREK